MKRKFCLSLLACLFFAAAWSQNRQVTGRVVSDSSRAGLAGVNVTVKGSNTTTATNSNGDFSISIPNRTGVVLVFSSVGYTPQEFVVGNRTTADIVLASQSSVLNDVVVVGYQTVRRRDLTASVSSVNARQLKDIPINSAAQALAGRLAGVQVTGTEGAPGAEVQIRVRGGGSITQDNSPLYIIDGVQVENALSTISPQDIESIDVLKDASATAIYGSRGANGVVIITTKGGRARRPVISYNGFVGYAQLANKLEVMRPYDFVTYEYERARQGGYNSSDSSSVANQYGTTWDTLKNYRNVPFVDWQDQMFGRKAFTTTHNVSLTGGDTKSLYSLSLTSNKEEGLMLGSGYDRKLVNFKFDHTFSNMLKLGFSTRYNNTHIDGAGTSNTGSAGTNRLRQSVRYRPFLTRGQEIDDYDYALYNETNANGVNLVNPLLLNQAEYRKALQTTTNLTGYIELKFTKYLTLRSTAGFDFYDTRSDAFDDTITSNSKLNGAVQPLAAISMSRRVTINNSNVLTFSSQGLGGSFADKNRLTVLVGHEIYQTNTKVENQLAKLFPVGITPEKALNNFNLGTLYTDPSRVPTSEVNEHLLSFFGRVDYAYNNKYQFSGTLRADGSSKFAQGNKWGYFPSGSVAWRVSNERFFESVKKTINDLKFRVSYGEAGNNRIPNFLYLTQFGANTQYYDANDNLITAYTPTALANVNLKWETTISRNLGMDISLLKNRLQVSVDVYRNTTKDLLVNVPVPTSSGYTAQVQNVGSTSNRGVETQISAALVQSKNFSWNANFNLSYNKNKVLSLGTFQKSFLANSGWGFSNTPADYIIRVGDPVGSMYGFVTDGYYKVSDFNYDASTGIYTLKPGVASNAGVTSIVQPGSLKFRDLNGDSLINDNDKTIIGNAQPKFFGGLNQQFTYKSFDFSIFVNYQIGGDVYNANKLEFTSGYTPNANLLAIMNNRWRTVDANGNVLQRVVTLNNVQTVIGVAPELLAKANANATLWIPSTSSTSFVLHSWAIEDASFLRINNITVGYSLPKSLIQRLHFQTLRIYATVNNVAVLTGYSGYDPEVSARRGNPVTPGVDYSAYPRGRTFLAGLNLTF